MFFVFVVFLGVSLVMGKALNKLLEPLKPRQVQGKLQENQRPKKFHKVSTIESLILRKGYQKMLEKGEFRQMVKVLLVVVVVVLVKGIGSQAMGGE